jgi:hypothetical protein
MAKKVRGFMNKHYIVIFTVLTLMAIPLGLWAASSDTWDSYDPLQQQVGGAPICVTFGGQTPGTADVLTVTTPDGFKPSYVVFHKNHTASTANDYYEWMAPMAASSSIAHTNGSLISHNSSSLITVGTGSIVFAAGSQVANGQYIGRACR